jgi:hypothetical protein
MFARNLEVREIYRVSHSISASFIIGHVETHTDHDFRLINGWVVEDYRLDHTASGLGYGAVYDRRPRPSSTDASSRVRIWADAFSHCTSYNYLWIIGPSGLPYR